MKDRVLAQAVTPNWQTGLVVSVSPWRRDFISEPQSCNHSVYDCYDLNDKTCA